jgi:PAS domain S-box-containing protein
MRSKDQYFIAAIVVVLGVAAAAFVPVLRQTPGLVVLSVLALVALLVPTGPALLGIAMGAVGMVFVRPQPSVAAETVRVALYIILGGAFAAVRYGRQRAVEASAQYRMLFDENPLPMWLYDDQTLAFLAVNQAALDRYGYTREEFMRLTLTDVRPVPDDGASAARSAPDPPRYAATSRHRTKDGTVLTVLVRSHLVDHDGRRARLALIEDVTERTALEEELRQSQKMDAIGQLAGGIAHDFNNLLTAIHGYAMLLFESLPDHDTRREDLSQIRLAAERAAGLTRQLLAFSRKQILDPRVVSASETVKDLVPMLRRLVEETIEINTVLKAHGHVNVDPGQLQQVVMNLVVNARDAMEGRAGRITIETGDVVLDAAYAEQHLTAQPGRHVMVAVTDTGRGIDAATQPHLFEPFFTTKPRGKGTGLGLSTVHGIVGQSGGHLGVYSEVGHGTTFRVYLPTTDEPVSPSTVGRTPSGPRPASATILLLEDEDALRRLVVRVLGQRGYTIHATARPAEALELARRPGLTFDLLLTDVVLPDMNGQAAAAQIQLLQPACRVLFMSGYTEDAIVRHGVLTSTVAFLSKPFTATDLIQKVDDVLDGPR